MSGINILHLSLYFEALRAPWTLYDGWRTLPRHQVPVLDNLHAISKLYICLVAARTDTVSSPSALYQLDSGFGLYAFSVSIFALQFTQP